MFPFIGGVADLRAALALLEEARDELRRAGIPFEDEVPVGLTLELPSAAFTADLLAPHVDFFSVGTNDLIQYLLAVDRADPRLAALYQPLDPAVLRAIGAIIAAAHAAQVPLALCGEMAADPLHALLLLGLGVRDLSMGPSSIPKVKAALRGVRVEDCASRGRGGAGPRDGRGHRGHGEAGPRLGSQRLRRGQGRPHGGSRGRGRAGLRRLRARLRRFSIRGGSGSPRGRW